MRNLKMPRITKQDADKAQSRRFIDKARELGCDEDEAAFDERLRKIAKAQPTVEPSKQRPKSKP